MTNPQSEILKELEKIKKEIIEFGKKHEIKDIIDIDSTMRELESANKKVEKIINQLTKIREKLNGPLMSLEKNEHKISSS